MSENLFQIIKKEISFDTSSSQTKEKPFLENSRHAPFLLFSLKTNNCHLSQEQNRFTLVGAPFSPKRGGANASTKKQILLLLRGFSRFLWSRSWSRSGCHCRRRRSWGLSRFHLLFGCWFRCLLCFASNPKCGNINHQNHCEEKKNPLLHVTSPPF